MQFRQKNILIIDPSELTRNALKNHFEQKGAVVYTLGQVEKIIPAIEGAAVSGNAINLILVDVRLSGCFAFYVLKKIHEGLDGAQVPIYVHSYGFSNLALRQMVRWGVLGYLPKPYRLDQLDAFFEERYKESQETVVETQQHGHQRKAA